MEIFSFALKCYRQPTDEDRTFRFPLCPRPTEKGKVSGCWGYPVSLKITMVVDFTLCAKWFTLRIRIIRL